MPLEIVTVPCLRDNYAYLLRDAATGRVGLVDAPEAAPIEAALTARGWGLDLILITHHHGDHIDGVEALRRGVRRARWRARRRTRGGCRRSTSRSATGDTVALGESVARGHRRARAHGRARRLLLRRGRRRCSRPTA